MASLFTDQEGSTEVLVEYEWLCSWTSGFSLCKSLTHWVEQQYRILTALRKPSNAVQRSDYMPQDLLDSYRRSMETALETDADSRLGTYYRVNPSLEKYVPKPQPTLEIERELVTRYRTGSHSLAIELGRYSNTARENRVCCCGNSVQSVWHLFTECPLTHPIVDHQSYSNLCEVFGDGDVHRKLLMICSKLKIAIWLEI